MVGKCKDLAAFRLLDVWDARRGGNEIEELRDDLRAVAVHFQGFNMRNDVRDGFALVHQKTEQRITEARRGDTRDLAESFSGDALVVKHASRLQQSDGSAQV